MVSVWENTGEEDKLNQTYVDSTIRQIDTICSVITCLSCYIHNWSKSHSWHAMNSGIARSNGLGLFFDRTWWGKDMLVSLEHGGKVNWKFFYQVLSEQGCVSQSISQEGCEEHCKTIQETWAIFFLICRHAHRTLAHPQYPYSPITKLVLLPTNLAASVEVWMEMRASLSWLLNRSLVHNLFSISLSSTDHIYFRGTQENLALPYICNFQTWCYPPVPWRLTMPFLCLCCFQVQTAHGWCLPLPRLQR